MTKEQIEKKAHEIIGEDCKKENCLQCGGRLSAELGCAHFQEMMELANWLLSHQWVSVEDELPPRKNGGDYSDRVIIITEPLIISASCYDYDRHRWLGGYAVTHWMPIPPLAEEGGEK